MSADTFVKRARDRFSHHDSRQYLIEKYQNRLQLTHSGSLFKVTHELIALLRQPLIDDTDLSLDTIIILDVYNNPVKVNRPEMLKLATETYSQIMSQWHEEYTKLSELR
jgi:hypothetical protein